MPKAIKAIRPVMTDKEADRRVKAAVKYAIARQEDMGVPVARYDRKKGYIYYTDKDGNIKIVRKIADRRRYSERCKNGKKA